MFRPTHAYGHTLDLVLSLGDSGGVDLNVLPISSSISDHDMKFFHVNFSKTCSSLNLLHSRNIRVGDASRFLCIERT